MPLANYWNFLNSLRQPSSLTRRRVSQTAQSQGRFTVATEALEVRLVPAAVPLLSITPDVTVVEGNADTTEVTLTVSLSSPSTSPVSVAFTTLDETATADGQDYEADSNFLTFAPGETSKTITLQILGDTRQELDETFYVALFNASGARLRARDALSTVTITNDDQAPTISIADPEIAFEGNSGNRILYFPVTLSNPSDQTVTISYSTSDGTATTADNDYVAATGTITFFAGETTKNIPVTIQGDTADESNETLTVTLSGATNGTIGTATATGTIGDDDTLPTLSVNNPANIDEGNTGTATVLFTITLSSASDVPVTVAYTTADGTATIADTDYEAASGTLTFAPGETTKTVAVKVKGDTKNETDETVQLVLSTPSNAILADATGVATITNDDLAVPSITINPSPVITEGNSGTTEATFTVVLSQASGQTVTVAIATADGTAKVADNDYVANSATLTFAPGETSKTFVVQIKGDELREGNETFSVTLTSPTNATLGTTTRTATITDDDAGYVSISAAKNGAESSTVVNGQFTVTLAGSSSVDTVVTYTVAGTATAGDGNDYQTLTGTVTIPAGQTSAVIDVIPLNDQLDEDTETVIVTLTAVTTTDTNVQLSPTEENLSATVKIIDSNDVPLLNVGGLAINYQKNDGPVAIMPDAEVSGVELGGGKLTIAFAPFGNARKVFDLLNSTVSPDTIGTSVTPQMVNGQVVQEITLKTDVTAAEIQAYLRSLTFETKGKGLKAAARTMTVTLTASGLSSTVTQTINTSR